MGNVSGCFSSPDAKTRGQPERAKQSNTKECDICVTVRPKNKKYFPKVDGCTHTPKICFFCVDRHVLTEMNTKGNVERIRCPIIRCNNYYSYNEIRKITKPETFQRLDHLLAMKNLSRLHNTLTNTIICV